IRVTSLPSAGRSESQRSISYMSSPFTGLMCSSSGFHAPAQERCGRKRCSPTRMKYELCSVMFAPSATRDGVEDEGRAERRGERGEGAARLRALLERARVVAEKEVDLAAGAEALKSVPLA